MSQRPNFPPIFDPEIVLQRLPTAPSGYEGPQVRPPQSGPAPVAPTPYNPANPNAPRSVAPFTGFTPKWAMEGFDYARLQDPNKSAKDAFAYYSNLAGVPPPIHDKDALAAWFNQYVKPGMLEQGHQITDVQGDKFRFNNWQGDFWVDYGRGAGAQGGALAWQADPAGVPAQQSYNQTQQAILRQSPQQTQHVGQAVQGAQGVPNADLGQYYQFLQQMMSR